MAKTHSKTTVPAVKDSQLLAPKRTAPPGGANDNLVDEISEDFDKFETWVIANGKYILIGCAAVLVAVAVFFIVAHVTAQSRNAATLRLGNAEKIEQLESALKEISPSVPGYDVAQIRLARLYAAAKKYDEAFQNYRATAERKADLYLSVRARLDSAYVKELAGKKQEAAAIFALVADSAGVLADLRAEGAYAAGRLFLAAGDTAHARRYLAMTDPAKAVSQTAAQWASLSHALLNRIPKTAPKKPADPVRKAVSTGKK